MRASYIILVFVLFVSIGFSSSSDKSSRDVEQVQLNIDNLYPLAVGNRWTYGNSAYQETETITEKGFLNEVMTYAGDYKQRTYDREYRGLDLDYTFGVYKDGNVLVKVLTGVSLRGTAIFDERIVLKEPIKVGTSWSNVIRGDTIKCSIVAVNDTISHEGIEYKNCIVVKQKNEVYVKGVKHTLVDYEYLCPGIGIVAVRSGMVKGVEKMPSRSSLELIRFLKDYEIVTSQ